MIDKASTVDSLYAAGIEVMDYVWNGTTVPAAAAWMLSACSIADGRVDFEVMFDDPRIIEKANAAWFDFATSGGLFNENREFLVSVGPVDGENPVRPHWARVRLNECWDVMGVGTECGVLGGPRGRPGFVMMSLDERVLIGATTWDGFMSVMRLLSPIDAEPIRRAMNIAGPRA
ncbi:hypothetical protein [Catenuloplanes indicus]|uniref:Uncharacterized protein n=1 Tax=Catenuloplanes indicus TaxID=137267 RepID=A0AAE4AWH9_9ACTN|nr:hypothetical protein [Catenuloplanes indicus]MDQ0365059.1 hypothetical protein [Catenuloplanes indicus]